MALSKSVRLFCNKCEGEVTNEFRKMIENPLAGLNLPLERLETWAATYLMDDEEQRRLWGDFSEYERFGIDTCGKYFLGAALAGVLCERCDKSSKRARSQGAINLQLLKDGKTEQP